MPQPTAPLFAFKASGIFGSKRRGRRRLVPLLTTTHRALGATFIDSHTPDTNYGADLSLNTGASYLGGAKNGLFRALLPFDLSTLTDRRVLTASLRISVSLVDVPATFRRLSRLNPPRSWLEFQATWRHRLTGTLWDNAGGNGWNEDPLLYTHPTPLTPGILNLSGLEALSQDAIDNNGGGLWLNHRGSNEAPGAIDRMFYVSPTASPSASEPLLTIVSEA